MSLEPHTLRGAPLPRALAAGARGAACHEEPCRGGALPPAGSGRGVATGLGEKAERGKIERGEKP